MSFSRDWAITTEPPMSAASLLREEAYGDSMEHCNTKHDPVNHPRHYTAHASGIECIQVTEYMGFCLGNAVKYIWRADLKSDAIEDLKKARWYLDREIVKREGARLDQSVPKAAP